MLRRFSEIGCVLGCCADDVCSVVHRFIAKPIAETEMDFSKFLDAVHHNNVKTATIAGTDITGGWCPAGVQTLLRSYRPVRRQGNRRQVRTPSLAVADL